MRTVLVLALSWMFLLKNVVHAILGFDTSSSTSTAAFACFKKEGRGRAVIRSYFEAWGSRPGGAIDPSFVSNYRGAIAAGLTDIDVYMFPCTGRSTCKPAKTQIQDVINTINANKMKIGRIWLDIEVDPVSKNWPQVTGNKNTAVAFRDAFKSSGHAWGVYASRSQWQNVFGNANWVLDSSVPLWYAHYDNSASFSDFTSFGGWTKPTIKQYAGTTKICGASVDLNYYA